MAEPDLSATRPVPTAFVVAWSLFWLLMLTIAVQEHARELEPAWWKPVLWEGSSCLVATVMLRLMWKRSLTLNATLANPARWFARHLMWLPLLAPGFVALTFALRHAAYALAGLGYAHAPWHEVLLYESTKFALFYSLFVAVVFALRTHAALIEARLLARQAQLVQLAQQLQPHFLFNALNTIAATIHDDPERADRLLTHLAALLRAASDLSRRPYCTLAQELALAEGYAALMRERFADRVRLHWDVDGAARACRVPTLALQSLLENAFRHGVERERERTEIDVIARCFAGRLRVEVVQSRGALTATTDPGVGLATLHARMRAAYGDLAGVGLEPRSPTGVLAWFELPCEH